MATKEGMSFDETEKIYYSCFADLALCKTKQDWIKGLITTVLKAKGL